MRQVLEIVPRSSADWDETKLTCLGQGEALSDCVASARDAGRPSRRGHAALPLSGCVHYAGLVHDDRAENVPLTALLRS
jgi:hypothetical protein